MSRVSPPALELHRVDVDCLEEILAILNSAAAWLRSKGVEQWPDRFDAEHVLPAILRGETWLARLDGEPAGTITLNWSDPLWHPADEDAGYVHRLAVLRSTPGLGLRLLDWAAEAVRLRGCRWLRLDCVSTNRRLRAHYEAAGFRHCGDVPVPRPQPLRVGDDGAGSHSLYELQLGT